MNNSVGVIIGRFQTPYLHDGHIHLINHVRDNNSKVIILVGSTPGILCSPIDPLDFITRKIMIQQLYPDIIILPVYDMPSDEDWSKSIDFKIKEAMGDLYNVVLYGSRDSFIPYYTGKHKVVELNPSVNISATSIRENVSSHPISTEGGRIGMIYSAINRYPTMYQTVDIAVISQSRESILLGRKSSDKKGFWRFPGGFLDSRKDTSLEQAAKRELLEEIGLNVNVGPLVYAGSTRIDDWRYRKQIDKIMTTVFVTEHLWGMPDAGDDLSEADWHNLSNAKNVLVEQHRPILDIVLDYLKRNPKKEELKEEEKIDV